MMPRLIVNDETKRLIEAHADPSLPWVETGRRLASGQWEIPISEATASGLSQIRLFGETDDEVLVRFFAIFDRKGRLN
jgi:hypothetical protein